MPAVTELSKPNGEPIAITHSPAFSALGSPMRTVGSRLMLRDGRDIDDCRPVSLDQWAEIRQATDDGCCRDTHRWLPGGWRRGLRAGQRGRLPRPAAGNCQQ